MAGFLRVVHIQARPGERVCDAVVMVMMMMVGVCVIVVALCGAFSALVWIIWRDFEGVVPNFEKLGYDCAWGLQDVLVALCVYVCMYVFMHAWVNFEELGYDCAWRLCMYVCVYGCDCATGLWDV